MKRVWYRRDQEAVLAALRRGERPDLATATACGPLDELLALHDELGIFRLLRPDSCFPGPGRPARRLVAADAGRPALRRRAVPRRGRRRGVPRAGGLAPARLGPRPDPQRRERPAPPPRGPPGQIPPRPPRHAPRRTPADHGAGLGQGPKGRHPGPVLAAA